MSLYIELRDEILYDEDEVPVRQYWIKADSIEVLDRLSPTSESLRSSNFTGVAYLDSKTGEWRVVYRERGKFYMGGKLFKYRGVTYPINKESDIRTVAGHGYVIPSIYRWRPCSSTSYI